MGETNMTYTAAILIAFALGHFVAKLIYGIQLHRRESERIAEQNNERMLSDKK